MIRKILSVILGLAIAVATFIITETLNNRLHPVSSSLDYTDNIAVKTFYENQALSFWLIVLIGWTLGSFLCGFLIKIISKSENKILPTIAGVLLTLSAVANFFTFPHPIWFIIIGLIVFIPSTLFGHKLYKINTNG